MLSPWGASRLSLGGRASVSGPAGGSLTGSPVPERVPVAGVPGRPEPRAGEHGPGQHQPDAGAASAEEEAAGGGETGTAYQ